MRFSRQFVRYCIVGLAVTALGYGVILAGLWSGLGDYPANLLGYAVGLCFSFFANRRFTFDRSGSVNPAEIGRFLACFALSYAANLAVIAGGRSAGLAEHPLVHLAAMAVYSLLFFFLMRTITFARDTP